MCALRPGGYFRTHTFYLNLFVFGNLFAKLQLIINYQLLIMGTRQGVESSKNGRRIGRCDAESLG
jgi:hypothetical protein